MPQALSLLFHGRAYRHGISVEHVRNELVRMLGLDAVVTGNSDGQLVLWRKGTAEAIKQVALSERGSLARRLYVSPDAKRIFVGIREAVVIYDAELNELARLTSMDAIPESFAVSRDGKVLLCGMADSTVLVWSLDKLLK